MKFYVMLLVTSLLCIQTSYCQTCQWAQRISGCIDDYWLSFDKIAVDKTGNVYIVGFFDSNTLNFNNGIQLRNSGGIEGYLAKFNSSGSCQWAQKISGSEFDNTTSIAVDSIGDVYITGFFLSPILRFNNNISITNNGQERHYIAKYNSSGECQWAEKISSTSDFESFYIAVYGIDNVYIAGTFWSSCKFNNGIFLSNSSSSVDVFIAKYNSSGKCQWAHKIGGNKNEYVTSIAVDSYGNPYVAGYYASSVLYFSNEISLNANSANGGYFAKYDTSGTCQWAQEITGLSHNFVYDYRDDGDFDYSNSWNNKSTNNIVVDASSNVYVSGTFDSVVGFNNGISLPKGIGEDSFIAKYDTNQICLWAEKISGIGFDKAFSLSLDNSGDIYIAGSSTSPTVSFNNNITLNNSGGRDAYFTKYNSSGSCLWAEKISGTRGESASSIVVDGAGNIFVAGLYFSPTLNFNNGILLPDSILDAFIVKYKQIPSLSIITSSISPTSFCQGETVSVPFSINWYL